MNKQNNHLFKKFLPKSENFYKIIYDFVKREFKSSLYTLMKVINKVYKFRIYSNKEQEILLSKHFGCSRVVYNYFLNASKNILKKGLKIYGKELTITKVERKSDFSDKAHSMKPETHLMCSSYKLLIC